MGGADEEWVQAAMSDDAMVVEILVRLHHVPPPPPLSSSLVKRLSLPLEWSVRQRRSRFVSSNDNPKKPTHSQRDSPATPLSWSGGGTSSGAVGSVSEECSRMTSPLKVSSASRSKINIDCEQTNSKRSRKKKTLAELKSEEISLVKERKDLKREMETLQLYLERQRATNENLKRMKVESQPHLDEESKSTYPAAVESTSGQLQPEKAVPQPPALTAIAITQQPLAPNACSEEKTDVKFVLPDLNVPFDGPSCDIIWGIGS